MIWVFRILAVAVATVILVLSLQPFTGSLGVNHADKVQHLLAYGLLAGLMALGWPRCRPVWIVAIAALFGLGVELAQGVMSQGRTASGLDALANLIGALLASFALPRARSLLRRRNERMR
ncbi:VanZ family protein [Algimonas porphyrae]|uniref:VanZ family protein n=1 Tax=Algimonas porphyrae TaxID=1128113 RepID=A0ABQ5V1K9_9PROT|nr:hypothetical protein [Algimonas porphyrae]GLQ20693.1 hypothetical protein GCM10007854_16480 [Algimonas porphyrae]